MGRILGPSSLQTMHCFSLELIATLFFTCGHCLLPMCSEISLHFLDSPWVVLADWGKYFSETCVEKHIFLVLEALLDYIWFSLKLLKQKLPQTNGRHWTGKCFCPSLFPSCRLWLPNFRKYASCDHYWAYIWPTQSLNNVAFLFLKTLFFDKLLFCKFLYW